MSPANITIFVIEVLVVRDRSEAGEMAYLNASDQRVQSIDDVRCRPVLSGYRGIDMLALDVEEQDVKVSAPLMIPLF